MNDIYRSPESAVIRDKESALATNKVLRSTYLLLSATLLFSAACAGITMAMGMAPISPWITIIGYIGLLFATHMNRNSVVGLFFVFALTGFMGATLGPIVSMYVKFLPNGGELVMQALGGTGLIFVALSAYAIKTEKDFSFMSGFLTAGAVVLVLSMIAGFVFQMPLVMLAVSAGFMIFSSALILYQTGEIINGGETNYISATVTLYVSIYNLFTSLLHILSALSGDD